MLIISFMKPMWTNILFVVTLLERVVYVPDIYLRSSKKLALK